MSQGTRRRSTNGAKRRAACLSAANAALRATVHPHDVPIATGSISPSRNAPAAGRVQASQRQLLMQGLTAIEASNVVAYLAGLHAAEHGWTVDEIDRLVALRALVECGGMTP